MTARNSSVLMTVLSSPIRNGLSMEYLGYSGVSMIGKEDSLARSSGFFVVKMQSISVDNTIEG
jgi:hypothetical protein